MRLRFAAVSAFAQLGPLDDIVIRNGRLLDGNGNPWVKRMSRSKAGAS
jgi:hypothetical protein